MSPLRVSAAISGNEFARVERNVTRRAGLCRAQ
jgi:hypothetical protein